MEKTSINMIVDSGASRPMPVPAPRDCENVTSFSLSGSCGNSSYQMVSYTCGSVRTQKRMGEAAADSAKGWQQQGGKSSCKSFTTWYSEAQSDCAKSCPPATPTPTVKPNPTCIPQPGCPAGKVCPTFKYDPRYCGVVTKPPTPATTAPRPTSTTTKTVPVPMPVSTTK